jgi:hypothetical protein
MSPKKAILKALSDSHRHQGPEKLVRPPSIPGFREAPEKYQKTINNLLRERLIEGVKDQDGCLAISLNPHRIREVRRELRPIWAHPGLMALAVILLVMATVGLVG